MGALYKERQITISDFEIEMVGEE
ncbi:MAG: hypothetical protein IPP51_00310 [Bacteroidetes bacterium]|nr:hypothetical protein [Bacteroidota bacterium]